MLEEVGLVIQADSKHLVVETQRNSSCSHCSRTGCETSLLASLFSTKKNYLRLSNSLGVMPGEKVVIGMQDKLLVRSAIWAYFMPISLMIVVTIIASLLGASDGLQSLIALSGLVFGFYVNNQYTGRKDMQKKFTPELLRRVSSNEMPVNFVDKVNE